MTQRNEPLKSSRNGLRRQQRRSKAEKVVTFVVFAAAWLCLYWALPETWREWLDWLTGESVPDWLEWTAYLAIFALVVFVDLLIEYVQEFTKKLQGSQKIGQGAKISHAEEQRIAEVSEAYRGMQHAISAIKAHILDPALFHRMVSSGDSGDDDNLRRSLETEIDDFEQKESDILDLTDDDELADDIRELRRLSRLIFHPFKRTDFFVGSGRSGSEQENDTLKTIDEYSDNCLTWLSLAKKISSQIEAKGFRVRTTQRKESRSVESPLTVNTD
jgi:hypothetical protein